MKLLSFDIESNGLHGAAFAVGALLMDATGRVESEFVGRCPVVGELDPWVQENVLPPLADLPEAHPDGRALRQAFWGWYRAAKPAADYVLVNNGYPVEARFLLACQEDDLAGRYVEHPFPLLDLASLLVQAGIRTHEDKDEFMRQHVDQTSQLPHHPRWDAWAAATAAFILLKQAKGPATFR